MSVAGPPEARALQELVAGLDLANEDVNEPDNSVSFLRQASGVRSAQRFF